MVKILLILMTAVLCPRAYASDGPIINEHNWKQHPKIVEIRKIVEPIEAEIRQGQLQITKRNFCYENPGWTDHEIARNKAGQTLRYVRVGGSDDSKITESNYYDSNGNLRFVYQVIGRVHVGESNNRLYFDSTGKLLWQTAVAESLNYSTDPKKDFAFAPEQDLKEARNGKEIPGGQNKDLFCR